MTANHAGASRVRNDLWLARLKPNPQASLRLFCFPYSGASASLYYPWASSLPSFIELCPVELPGRGTRLAEPPCSRIEDLIPPLAAALQPHLDKPFAFFGHSMGALVSFELTRYLRREYHREPVHLFVSGHGAPQVPDHNDPIHDLPEPEFVSRLREFNGTPDQVLADAELRSLVLPILRADFALCETYVYQADEPLSSPLSALGGLRDAYTSREALDAWRVQTHGPFALRMFPGDHFYLNTDRQMLLPLLARELMRYAAPAGRPG